MEPSPYLPTTRRFVNPLYLRVEDDPRVGATSPPADAAAASSGRAATARAPTPTPTCSTATPSWQAKRRPCDRSSTLPRVARRAARVRGVPSSARARGWSTSPPGARWPRSTGCPGPDWPEELQDPAAAAVAGRARAARRAGRVPPLAAVGGRRAARPRRRQAARHAGHGDRRRARPGRRRAPRGRRRLGACATCSPGGVSVGRPAGPVQPDGPELVAAAVAAGPARRARLRAVPRHAPHGPAPRRRAAHRPRHRPVPAVVGARGACPPDDGTYVRYDHEALVGILALEAHRAGAVVVGEDLGMVEPWVRDYLRERGILGTSILWFEKDEQRPAAAAGVTGASCAWPPSPRTTCRRPPATWPASTSAARASSACSPGRWRRSGPRSTPPSRRPCSSMLRERGLLAARRAPRATLVEALHRLLARTPARLLGVSLTDAGRRPARQNQPGTDKEYPNWRVPLADAGRPRRAARGPDGLALGPPAGAARSPSADGTRRRHATGPPEPRGSGGPARASAPVSRGRRPAPGRRSARVMPSRFSATSRRRPAGASACASSHACVASASSWLGQQRG